MTENYTAQASLHTNYSTPLPGVVSEAEAKLAELEARLAALEELIKNLIAKYFGTHL